LLLLRAACLSIIIDLTPQHVFAAEANTLMRFPSLHGNTIVFEAHGNLWQVGRSGGTAQRLTSEPGYELMPRYSPDGKWIAFTGDYQGNRDVYVIPAAGGEARRLTFHSDVVEDAPTRWGPDNMVVTWTPDSKNIVFLSRRAAWNDGFGRLFRVSLDGGLPVALPLDRGGLMTYGPDGNSIAYNRIFRNFRTWKRYDGGMAQDIYTYDFSNKKLTRITDWKGTETAPMWYGQTIYFLSDHDDHRRANLWAYDLETKQFRQVTRFTDYDIDFPSLGATVPGQDGIVFQQGGSLFVLDLPSEQLHRLDVLTPDDGVRTGPRYVDAADYLRDTDAAQQADYDLAPNGKRALFTARGELFSVPAEHGDTRNLTETSGADEDHPAWSPDGAWVAYTTDVGGEQQIAIRPGAGGAEKILTNFKSGFLYQPVWSPGGDRLAFSDSANRLWRLDVAGGAPQQVAQDHYQEMHDYAWSPDGRWLAYSLTDDNQVLSIWLYSLESGKATKVSASRDNDFRPVFDPEGKYLYFISMRHENPTFSESEFNIATLKSMGVYAATLQADEPSPLAPRSDEARVEVAAKDGKAADKKGAGKDEEAGGKWQPGASKPVRIDLEGLMQRAVPLPLTPATIFRMDARKGAVYYMTQPPQTIGGTLPGETSELHVFDLKKREDKVVVGDLDSYRLSADGQKVLYKKDRNFFIVDAASAGSQNSSGGGALDLSHMRTRVEPRQEWRELFTNAWRLERDVFFNPRMNGVDWDAVRGSYEKLLSLAGSREDLNYVIGEMLGELSNSHTYVGGGDRHKTTDPVATGLLGVDFGLDERSGRYYFADIFPGDNTRDGYRSPLTRPGLNVKKGDYLLAVDGHPLQAPVNPYSLFVGKNEGTVKLTVADSPDGKPRDVVVEPVKEEVPLREQNWIDHNRTTVDRLSGGKVAYIYLSDMSVLGMQQFIRQFYNQMDKQALIVDDRWNGGGFIDQIVLERLRRVLVGMRVNRERAGTTVPQTLIRGPKVCLINHYSASDGDLFPFFFRKYGLGPLIGTRTWGGVRGIRGYWPLLDGGYITVPEGSFYGLDSQWIIENRGVEPDTEVRDSPADWMAGKDVQLAAGVTYLLNELKKQPENLPPPPDLVPSYPPPGHE